LIAFRVFLEGAVDKIVRVVAGMVVVAFALASGVGLAARETLPEKRILLNLANDAAQATLSTCRQAGFLNSAAVLDWGGRLIRQQVYG
jgi:hypothetical protein